jgi:hypothetical protein
VEVESAEGEDQCEELDGANNQVPAALDDVQENVQVSQEETDNNHSSTSRANDIQLMEVHKGGMRLHYSGFIYVRDRIHVDKLYVSFICICIQGAEGGPKVLNQL